MKRFLAALLLPACAAAAANDVGPTKPVTPPPSPPAGVPFAARLDGVLAKQKGNLIYSPASIQAALAMAREGARGTTATEMDAVLGAGNGAYVKALLGSIPAAKAIKPKDGEPMPPELSIANRIFADKRTPFEKPFLDITRTDYGAPAELLDFRGGADGARKRINSWVEDKTHDKIKDLLARGSVDEMTRMVLVNAIYLKAQWATPFEPSATAAATFAVDGAAVVQVPTMRTVAHASWGNHDGARMLDLPYTAVGDTRLSMLVIVPDGDTLANVEQAYARQGLAPFLAATTSAGKADVALPKFEIGTTFQLADALKELGMRTAFTDDADFSGMSTVATQISAVIHKAWAKVDERGTEAAAATAVVMMETSVSIDTPHEFKVDRSFLFAIHDAKGNVLFAGRVIDPTAAQ
jgi:serpin B